MVRFLFLAIFRAVRFHIDEAIGIETSHIAHSREAGLEGDSGMDRGRVRFLCDVMPEAIDEELVIRLHAH